MIYSKLGNTDISVSKICLGTMTYGEQNTQKEAHEQLDYALDNGVNFIDTAEMYPVPPTKETYSKTETIIGNWDNLQNKRDKIVLATKMAGPQPTWTHLRDGKSKFIKEQLIEAVDNSLKRLNIDYIDLYQLHWPERSTNYFGQRGYQHANDSFTPFDETLRALEEIYKSGKVRTFGLSNETPWGACQFLKYADELSLPRMVSVQNPYSLLNRLYEVGLAEISMRENIGLLAYSPLGFGVLTGKYLNGQKPEGARLTIWDYFTRYNSENSMEATKRYAKLAADHGLTPTKLALAFVNSREFVTSNIIGATKMSQLKENIESANLTLSKEILEAIDQIHELIPNPAP